MTSLLSRYIGTIRTVKRVNCYAHILITFNLIAACIVYYKPKNDQMQSLNTIQTGLFSTFWDQRGGGGKGYSDWPFFDLLGPKGGRGGFRSFPQGPLKPLMLWPPNLHRIVYTLIALFTVTFSHLHYNVF